MLTYKKEETHSWSTITHKKGLKQVNYVTVYLLNHTIIALIPKVDTPMLTTDYRPISCCNVLFKCISKIFAIRIKGGLSSSVSSIQSAFVPGRRISDNILLTQELMHNYHRQRGPPRCAFKVDIQKAYGTVNWVFLEKVLEGFGFHLCMIKWIMICVSTASFSVSVNGNLYVYFKGKRGLMQGDPLSPYLCTMVMEILSLVLQRAVARDLRFRFHNGCQKLRLINLCFADDLFIFARRDLSSAKVIMESLRRFARMSGLLPSNQKSTVYFCNVSDQVKGTILNIIPFVEGNLPVKYLGVPLISSRLRARDCQVLVEKVEDRIGNWKNKMLSFAGRRQLILSVISSLYVYWSSVFTLPSSIVKKIEAKTREFLWAQGPLKKSRAKVAWKEVCLPKGEGGLGIKRIRDMNSALMSFHIWSVLSNRNSLWVEWIKKHRLRDRNLWSVQVPRDCSWGWKKILRLRPAIRDYVWSKLGNGNTVSVWYDKWVQGGPIINYISPREIRDAGFSLSDKVADMFVEGAWVWLTA